jgi:hypothetical protein
MKRGDIRDAADLKRRFRLLAKTCHPDVKGGDSGAAFLKLRVEYEEAMEGLESAETITGSRSGGKPRPAGKASSPEGRPRAGSSAEPEGPEARERDFDRGAFYQAFVDLISSGFPADSLVKAESRGYRKHREAAISFFSGLGPGCQELFLAFERELERLYANGILDSLAGQVRMILYNLSSYHNYPTAFALGALNKWKAEVLPLVRKRGLKAMERMLKWFLDDLANGAALANS